MAVNYRWATYGVGVIGHQLAEAMQTLGGSLYAVGNRTYEKAVAFAREYGIEKVYDDPDEMFTDDKVDIIYISTPHNTHSGLLKKALSHGKHVLCEKSITLNSQELQEAVALAEEHHVILAEAMTIYHMPVYRRLDEVIASGKLGDLKLIQMNFGSYKEYDMKNRFFNRNLAGGALLDIGVYALSFVRWFMHSCPDQIQSQVKLAPTGVDEQAGILLMNSRQEMATVTLSLHAKQPKRGTVAFDRGYVELFEYPRGERAVITYTEDGHQEVIEAGNTSEALAYEVMDMETAVSGGPNRMYLDYTIDVMEMMTRIRESWGIRYPEEEAAEQAAEEALKRRLEAESAGSPSPVLETPDGSGILYYVRHGQTEGNVTNRICGSTDSPLTEEGHRQAVELGEQMLKQGIAIDEILYSPLSRAKDTAEHLSKILGVPARMEPGLREQNFGKWESTPRSARGFKEAVTCFADSFGDGESMLRLCQRVYNLLDQLKKEPDKVYLLVAHDGVSRAVQSYFQNMSNEEFATFRIPNCKLERFVFPQT